MYKSTNLNPEPIQVPHEEQTFLIFSWQGFLTSNFQQIKVKRKIDSNNKFLSFILSELKRAIFLWNSLGYSQQEMEKGRGGTGAIFALPSMETYFSDENKQNGHISVKKQRNWWSLKSLVIYRYF